MTHTRPMPNHGFAEPRRAARADVEPEIVGEGALAGDGEHHFGMARRLWKEIKGIKKIKNTKGGWRDPLCQSRRLR